MFIFFVNQHDKTAKFDVGLLFETTTSLEKLDQLLLADVFALGP